MPSATVASLRMSFAIRADSGNLQTPQADLSLLLLAVEGMKSGSTAVFKPIKMRRACGKKAKGLVDPFAYDSQTASCEESGLHGSFMTVD